jgi:exodeoxyribonuclease-3
MAKTYSLYSWNVNGLRAAERKGLLDWVAKTKPDVLALQEIKAQEDQLSTAIKNVPGYEAAFFPAQRKGYSGVAVYSKLPVKKVEKGWGTAEFDAEGRVLVNEFDEFTMYSIYFPNGQSRAERLDYKMRFYEEFLKVLAKRRRKQKKIVICGDVNTAHREIDLARPKENQKTSGFLPQERAWIDTLLDKGYIDTFRRYCDAPERYSYWDQITRARERNVGWRIDYFFVSKELEPHLVGAEIHDKVMGSDHCPIELKLKF